VRRKGRWWSWLLLLETGGIGIDRDTGATSLVPRPTLAMPLLPMTCITANNNESAAKKRIFRDGTLGTRGGIKSLSPRGSTGMACCVELC
jgi:hypothetical protein